MDSSINRRDEHYNCFVQSTINVLVWEFHENKCVEYNLRTKKLLQITHNKKYKVESLSFRGIFFLNTLDDSIKNEPTLLAFNNKTKKRSVKESSCRICH